MSLKRILFIDDEPVLLEGLRRMLRPLRAEWELEFESSPTVALARLDVEPFDVVVTDMRMPLIDGVAVLTQVMRRHPHIIRLVLTGYSQLESSMRAVPIAHQFLLKPCDPESLKAAIGRISRMQERLSDPEMRALVGRISGLPVMPEVCRELNEALARPDFTIREISSIAEKDVALCAKILQLVNSSFFGSGRRLTYVHDAVSYLGTTLLKNVVTTMTMWRSLENVESSLLETQERLRRHSQSVAFLAKRMMGTNRMQAEEAFVSGLLHDVGEMVLVSFLPARVAEARAFAAERALPLHQAERELFGVTHADIGAYLLDAWGLPYPILEAAAYHHVAYDLGHTSLEPVDAVYVANLLLEARVAGESAGETVDTAYLERLGVADSLKEWTRWAGEV